MNHQIRFATDTDILGDGCLQERFTAYIEVIGHFALTAPRPIGIARMTEMMNISAAAMRRYLHDLRCAGILEKLRSAPDLWRLSKDPRDVTLEDVFRCAIAACAKRRVVATSSTVPAGSREIELLVQQALQTVDDHLYKRLRTYSVDRLIASGAALFPIRRGHSNFPFAEIA
jgi:DNA-binding IscR family transcriptional regulator